MSESKKEFEKIFSKIENGVKKMMKEDEFEDAMNQMLVKIDSFFCTSFLKVLEKFGKTKYKQINFNVSFDFKIIKEKVNKDFSKLDITASAESNIDDDKLKIEDFIK